MTRMPEDECDLDGEFDGTCIVCEGPGHYITCPTGGWWAHDVHPGDGHDFRVKTEEGCYTLPNGNCVGTEPCAHTVWPTGTILGGTDG